MRTRNEHLAWCMQRAIEILDAGDLDGAVASMISDLGKSREPLYDATTFAFLSADGMLFCETPEQARHWIEGFA